MGTNNATNNYQTAAVVTLNYNGATQTIRSATNVTSVTYSTNGRYIINFNGALADANYISILTISDSGGSGQLIQSAFINTVPGSGQTTTTLSVFAAGFDYYDDDYFIAAIFVN